MFQRIEGSPKARAKGKVKAYLREASGRDKAVRSMSSKEMAEELRELREMLALIIDHL